MTDGRRQAANLVTAITQALAPAVPALGWGIAVGARQGFASPAEVPAGYAFAIWGVIFALALVYAVQQVRPSAAAAPLYRAIGGRTALLFALSTLWMLVAQFQGPTVALAGIIVVMWALAVKAMFAAQAAGADAGGSGSVGGGGHAVAAALLGLYAGWLTLAVALNLSAVVRETGAIGPADAPYVIGVLLAAGAVAAAIVWRARGPVWYTLAVIWGLVAVTAHNAQEVAGVHLSVAFVAGLLAAAIAMAAAYRRV